MKTNLLCTSIVAVLAATAAFAQNSTQKATVPFAFIAGNQALPAGQYTVDRGPVAGAVTIRSADGKGATMILTHAVYSAETRDKGSLVFHRYGPTYFLSQVWSPGNDGRELSPTNRERELAARRETPANASIAEVR